MDQQQWAVKAGDAVLRGDIPWLTPVFCMAVIAMATLAIVLFLKRER